MRVVVVGGNYFEVTTLKGRPKVKVTLFGLLFSVISHPEFSSGWDPVDLDQISPRGGIQIH